MRGLDRCIGAKWISWRALVLLTTCFLCACASSNTGQRSKIKFRRGGGFTITEQVRFSSSVRGDFKQALRLIEDEEYEIGIQLLEQVIEAAPHATTAHIDLGIAYRLTGDYESASAESWKVKSRPLSNGMPRVWNKSPITMKCRTRVSRSHRPSSS